MRFPVTSSTRDSATRNSIKRLSIVGAGRGIGLAASVVSISLVAQRLPKEGLAAWLLIWSGAHLLSLVVDFGSSAWIVKVIAGRRSEAEPRAALLSSIAVTGVVYFAFAALILSEVGARSTAYVGVDIMQDYRLDLVLLSGALHLSRVSAELCRGYAALGRASVIEGSSKVLLVFGLLAHGAISGPLSVRAVSVIAILALVLSAVSALPLLPRLCGRIKLSDAAIAGRRFLRFGPSVTGDTVLSWASSQIDIWLLALYGVASSDIAVYGAASRLAALAGVPLAIAAGAVTDLVSKHAQSDVRRLKVQVRTFVNVSAMLSIGSAIAMWVLAPRALSTLYGADFISGATVLVLLAAGYAVATATGPSGIVLVQSGVVRPPLLLGLVSIVLLIPLSWLATMSFGASGMAGAVLGVVVLRNLGLAAAAYSYTGVATWAGRPRRIVGRPAPAGEVGICPSPEEPVPWSSHKK